MRRSHTLPGCLAYVSGFSSMVFFTISSILYVARPVIPFFKLYRRQDDARTTSVSHRSGMTACGFAQCHFLPGSFYTGPHQRHILKELRFTSLSYSTGLGPGIESNPSNRRRTKRFSSFIPANGHCRIRRRFFPHHFLKFIK